MERVKDNWEVWSTRASGRSVCRNNWAASLQKVHSTTETCEYYCKVNMTLLILILTMMKYQVYFSISCFALIFFIDIPFWFVFDFVLSGFYSVEEIVSQFLVTFVSFGLSLYQLLSFGFFQFFCFLPLPEVTLLLRAGRLLHNSKEQRSKGTVAKATRESAICTF